ncbi:MAG: hypothetical protein BRD55_03430 [Bacteroidetes bacterium SW_9_63_38]|nr:MAG: hypothetical protein BRD55_03430 [Bacteroidetes bacterium SW_9_63_38]
MIRFQVDVEEEAHKYVAIDTEAERLRPSRSTPISGPHPIGCWTDIRKPGGASGSAALAVQLLIRSGAALSIATWD